MKVLFRVDASSIIGSGHVQRCLVIAKYLDERGCTVSFASTINDDWSGREIIAAGFRLFPLKASLSVPREVREARSRIDYKTWLQKDETDEFCQMAEVVQKFSPDAIIVDHYGIDRSWSREVCSEKIILVTIDDLANRPLLTDLVIDPLPIPNPRERYSKLISPSTQFWGGIESGFFRPSLLRRIGRDSEDSNKIVCYFGSGDNERANQMLAQIIHQEKFRSIVFECVITDSNRKKFRNVPSNVRIHRLPVDLDKLHSQAGYALGAGGITMWERIILGVPSLIVAVAPNQHIGCKVAEEAGLVDYLGEENSITSDELSSRLYELVSHGSTKKTIRSSIAKYCEAKNFNVLERLYDFLCERSS